MRVVAPHATLTASKITLVGDNPHDAVGLRFDEALLLNACMVRPGLTHSCRLETRLSIGQ